MRAAVAGAIGVAAVAGALALTGQARAQDGCPDTPVKKLESITPRDLRAPVGGVASPLNAMIFYLARGPAGSCGANCAEWIAAEGKIEWDTHKRLIAFLDRHTDRQRPIVINSASPSHIRDAMSLGRIIRERGFSTMVGSTRAERCADLSESACFALKREGTPLAGRIEPAAECAFGCVLVLAGGVHRSILAGAKMSVSAICVGSRAGTKVPKEHREGVAARDYELIELYLAQMGIAGEVFDTIQRASRPARQIDIPRSDWWRLRLVTEQTL
jgi:hypothetical protein